MIPEEKYIPWTLAFFKLKRLLFYFISAFYFIGNIYDLTIISGSEYSTLRKINIVFVSVLVILVLLFAFKRIKVFNANRILLYLLIINVYISLYYTIEDVDFSAFFLRQSLIVGFTSFAAGFLISRYHTLIFATSFFIYYAVILFVTKNEFLMANTLVILIIIGNFMGWIYYMLVYLEKTYTNQFKLFRILNEKSNLLNEQKIELQKVNDTKNKLFSIIAHDLKNPFNVLIGFSELISIRSKEGRFDKIEDLSTHLVEAANHAHNLMEQLLDWSRSQTGEIIFKPLTYNLQEILAEVIDVYVAVADLKQIKLISKIDNSHEFVFDKNMVQTVFRNLVSNAIKFSEPETSIIIDCVEEQSHYLVSVKDHGIGMDREQLDKLFRVNSIQSKVGTNQETGTGLGLLIVHSFVKKHGGDIWVESDKGKGSTFFFTISKNI